MTTIEDTAASPARRGRLGCMGGCVLLALIAAGVCIFVYMRLEKGVVRTAREVRDAIAEITQLRPQVTINEQVFFEQSSPVLELATVNKPTQVEREQETQWLGSRKRLRLRGTYQIRAGFELKQRFNVKITDNQMLIEVPPPRILSIEQTNIEVLSFEDGLWNKIQPDELEAELRGMPALARQRASENKVQAEALEMLTNQLRERFAGQFSVEVRIARPPIAAPAD